MLPASLLVHTATPVAYRETTEEWIEGEPGAEGVEPELGEPFRCVLFLPGPGGSADTPYRPRAVKSPTVLYNPVRDDESAIVVGREDELLIEAPELAPWTGAAAARWQADGVAQPFGPPGQVIGVQLTVRQVLD